MMQRAGISLVDVGATPERRDRGVTFLETVLTVVLLGVVVVPALAAVRGAIKASSTSEAASVVETMLINAVDEVHRATNNPSTNCDLSAAAQSVRPSGWPESTVAVTQELRVTTPTSGWIPGNCPGTGQAQRITITISDPESTVTRTIQVVKTNG
jgi:Tfp pilus assembly protein PilE